MITLASLHRDEYYCAWMLNNLMLGLINESLYLPIQLLHNFLVN